MTTTTSSARPLPGGRIRARRVVALVACLVLASLLASLIGMDYIWPLYVFPLIAATVFCYELGAVIVAVWLGHHFLLWYSIAEVPTSRDIQTAVIGTLLLLAAGLVLGRIQRRHANVQARLAASSLTDRLTGLYNYGMFVDSLHREITRSDRYGGELSLIMLDLDHFKQFNDVHGHEAGNHLLTKVGQALRDHMRDTDIAARYGGEEFAVLMRGDETEAYELAHRLRRAVEAIALDVRQGQASTTISAGIATYPTSAHSELALVMFADESLYESKRRGRNRVTIHTGEPNEVQTPTPALSA
ncbi:MAG: GGDEF domain-containing protein [Thermoleophilia bacterium]